MKLNLKQILIPLAGCLVISFSTHAKESTSIVTVSSQGEVANIGGSNPVLSADGRYVAFESFAFNLVPKDKNLRNDIFVHDRKTRKTERVSVTSTGKEATGGIYGSLYSAISADGRYVAFNSDADNLVPGDTNGLVDVFVHDRQTGKTKRVNVSSDGSEALGETKNIPGYRSTLSADGRYVAFFSGANNLVLNDTNNATDIFLHDLETGQTERVSVFSDGEEIKFGAMDSIVSNFISADGRLVTFSTVNPDRPGQYPVIDVYLHDRQTGQTTLVSTDENGSSGNLDSYSPSISAAGSSVSFSSAARNLVPSDTNGMIDIFVHDIQNQFTSRVNVNSSGLQANESGFFNGLHNTTGISGNSQFVVFESGASNLVDDDTNGQHDVFMHDRLTAQTIRVSLSSTGEQANDLSGKTGFALSANGKVVAFTSDASNLVPNQKLKNQIYVRDFSDSVNGISTDLAITLNGPKTVKVNKKAVYTITISNKGKAKANSVVSNMQLAENIIVANKPTFCITAENQLTCDLGSISKGKQKSFKVTLIATTKGLIEHSVSIESSDIYDPNLSNNTKIIKVNVK